MNNPTIVCIDDEQFVLNSLRDQLLRGFAGKFMVEIAESGEEALALIEELLASGIDVPLVICDQIMPNFSGDQLLCEIHQRYPKIFKILLTGMASFDSVINTINHANLYRYISKPWDEADLNLAVREAIRSYQQEKRLAVQNLKLRAMNQTLEQEISERKQAELRLTYLAFHDTLTGLHNRKFFVEQVDSLLQAIQNSPSTRFAVMFIDLDRFKIINDSLGHDVGDQLLIEISNRLRKCVRSQDIIARLGGDEFTILMNPIDSIYDATKIAKQILSVLSRPFNLSGQLFSPSASIGILEGSSEYSSSIDLLRDADVAMYNAKHSGKARYAIFNRDMYNQNLQLWRLESALQNVLERDELYIDYQPIISLKTGKVVSLEALVRWQHPTRGLISPEEFIPVAEESGLILVIGEWVLRQVCQQLREWHRRFPHFGFLAVSVNVSSRQIYDRHCVEKIDRILAETGLDGRFLMLELNEAIFASAADVAIDTMHQLRDRNLQLSLDDFGKGHSSLSYLHRLPLQSLKVDRLFTQQVDAHPKSVSILQSIVSLAHNLGLGVIAEGLETIQQMERVAALGCEFGQGYFFSPPLKTETMGQYLAALGHD
ncbi:MAG: EAL domain-containing protein [Nodosilinea sp.]